jgi:phosphoenolpyruvate-protein kinase (PTS system EI component)
VAEVKAQVRRLELGACADLALRALRLASAAAVRELVAGEAEGAGKG